MWHLSEFLIHEKFPPVKELMMHTSNQQIIYFKSEMISQEIQSKMENNHTTLMVFFEYNARHEDGQHLLYQKFPEHYVLDPTTKN